MGGRTATRMLDDDAWAVDSSGAAAMVYGMYVVTTEKCSSGAEYESVHVYGIAYSVRSSAGN